MVHGLRSQLAAVLDEIDRLGNCLFRQMLPTHVRARKEKGAEQ
jgi:hypothetical protein